MGNLIFDKAIAQAEQFDVSAAVAKGISAPLLVYTVRDQITGDDGNQSFTLVGLCVEDEPRLLMDEELMILFSAIYDQMPKTLRDVLWETKYNFDHGKLLPELESVLSEKISAMDLPYEQLTYSLIATLLPFQE